MANVRLMLVQLWESRHKGSRRQAYPQPAAQPPATNAVVVAAVVVELGPEARTGSRRSMMTDDSRPSIYASNVLRRGGRADAATHPSVFVRQNERPAKMTRTKMALVRRG